ncbi:MAG: hypothetical protein NZM38_07215 [Cytophagales bacterium]|nr:hypothetical protein [Cytophagales bacterium]MDW8384546.1 hypothetical protein [Flammeovirgaceae bacterium]
MKNTWFNFKTYLIAIFIGIFSISCGDKASNEINEVEVYREKIASQKVMLDDAIKQLEYEKKQVKLLQDQIAIKEQQVQLAEKNENELKNLQASYARMKRDVEEWKALLSTQEKEYNKVKKDLDVVLNYLSSRNIQIVRNKMGEIEKLTSETLSSSGSSNFDSLMLILENERASNKQVITRLENMIANYQKEVLRWQKRFNENGIFLSEHLSNFIVILSADTSQNNQIQLNASLLRQIGKPKRGEISVRISCKMPNGNLFDVYTGKVAYQKKETKIKVNDIKPFDIEASGSHKIVVYLDNKEAYFEDMVFTRK